MLFGCGGTGRARPGGEAVAGAAARAPAPSAAACAVLPVARTTAPAVVAALLVRNWRLSTGNLLGPLDGSIEPFNGLKLTMCPWLVQDPLCGREGRAYSYVNQ